MKLIRRRYRTFERLENRCLLSADAEFSFSSSLDDVVATEFNFRDANGYNLPGAGGFVEIGASDTIQLVSELDDILDRYLRISYEKNEDLGMAYVPLSLEGYRPNHRETIRTTQWMLFESGFDFSIGQKIHRLYATNGNTNEFDILLQVHGESLPGLPDRDMSGVNDSGSVVLATNHSTENGRTDWAVGGDFTFQRDRWYKIDVELVLNTPGQSDGAGRFWIDDRLIGELENISIRGDSTYGVNRVGFGGWYSNAAGGVNPAVDPANESVVRIDDVRVDYYRDEILVGQEVSYQRWTDDGITRLFILGTDQDDEVTVESLGGKDYEVWGNGTKRIFSGIDEILIDLADGTKDEFQSYNNSAPDLNQIYNTEIVWISDRFPVENNAITPSLIRKSVGLTNQMTVVANGTDGKFIKRLSGWRYVGVERISGISVGHLLESSEASLTLINLLAQNPILPLDVNNDGLVTVIDALRVFNDLNRSGPRVIFLSSPNDYGFLVDVNGDNRVTPLDGLIVINSINRKLLPSNTLTPISYQSFQGQNHQLYPYEGRNVRVLAEQPNLDLDGLIAAIDAGYDTYFEATGRHPNDTSQSIGKTIIAQVPTCGAGCGLLGSRGIEIAPDFFDDAVLEFARSGKPDHIFYYEFGRNFWFYDDKLEFNRGRENQSERGSGDYMVNGFPIFMERAISEFRNIEFSGAGAGAAGFWESNARWLSGYLSDAQRDYSTDFASFSDSLYTDPVTGIRLGTMDFLAEILLDVAREHGEIEFVNRLWREVGHRNSWHDEASAIGNLISSASMAAGKDLVPLFRDVYKWPISDEASLYSEFPTSSFAEFGGGTLSGNYRPGVFSDVVQLEQAPQGIRRNDGSINFEWGAGSPMPGFPDQRFSVLWAGELFLPTAGTYEFEVFADDGVVLQIGDQVVIDSWTPQRLSLQGSIDVTAEMVGAVPIKLYFYENGGSATISLSWSSLHFGGIIPEEYFR